MLDIGSDMVCPDICKIGNPFSPAPLKKPTGRPIICHPGIVITDVSGKEFQKLISAFFTEKEVKST